MLKRIQRKMYSLHSLHSGYWNSARSMAATVAFHIRPVILRAVHPSFPIMAISRKRLLWFVWSFFLSMHTVSGGSHHTLLQFSSFDSLHSNLLYLSQNLSFHCSEHTANGGIWRHHEPSTFNRKILAQIRRKTSLSFNSRNSCILVKSV